MPLSAEQRKDLRSAPMIATPNKVRTARMLLGLKQNELAAAVGLRVPNVSDIERGDYKDLPLETTRLLAEFFGCFIEEIFPARSDRVPRGAALLREPAEAAQ